MALGKRYTFGFYDRQNNHITAEIYREGYTGSAEAVKTIGKPPVSITKGKPTDYVLEPLKGSSAAVRLHKTQLLQYLDFFSSDFKNSRLDVLVDGTLFWRGWGLPDIYAEPLLSRVITLSFTDGISLLSDIDFELTGTQTLFDIITHVLGILDLGLPLHSGASIREDSISATTSVEPLDEITFDCNQFDKWKCDRVLTQVLEKQGLRLYQETGAWIVEQIGDKTTGETIRKYNSSFVYQSVETQDNLITPPQTSGGIVKFLAKSAVVEMIPGWKRFQLKDDYGLKKSVIENSDFSNYIGTKVWYPPWGSLSGHYRTVGDFYNWQCTDDLDLFVRWFQGKQYMSLLNITDETIGASVSSHYVSNVIKPDVTAEDYQKMHIHFDFIFEGLYGTVSRHLYFMVKCGSFYLKSDGSWTATENIVDLGSYSPSSLHVNVESVDIYTSTVVSGNIEIRFYLPYINDASWIYYWGINNLQITFQTSTGESYIEDLQKTVVINSANNFDAADKNFSIVDLPVITNAKIMYSKGLKLIDGSLTDNWTYKGMQGTLSELFIYQIVEQYHKLKAKITGAGFYGDGAGFKNIFSISGLSDRRFMFSNYTHDLYRSTIESAQLVELPYMVEQNNAAAYFFAGYGTSVLNMKGANATWDETNGYITFPNVANDIFNKQNTTFWQAGLTIHDSDPRKWALSEFTGTAVILYSTAACRARLFFRDYESSLDSILPIMAFNTDRTEAQQAAIVEAFKEYYFIIDSGGFIIKDSNDDYIIESV